MIELQRQGGIARLSIRRAARKNAFTTSMWQQLLQACLTLTAERHEDPAGAARALMLCGEPNAFCAGADIEELAGLLADPDALAANHALVAQAQQALQALPLPTVALIDGPCFGGGFGLAAACDFRLGTPRSSFAVTPARLGLLYSLEDTRRLLSLLGGARTRALLLRGQRLDADTALAWGVLDALVDPDALEATAATWAAGLARQSPTSMAGIKATLGLLEGAGGADEASVRAAFDAAFHGPDFAEGAAAFLQRREPRF
jgi:enoyl-CoA hydratase/carnithine racemase